jgi:hypothetical protein
MALGEAGLGVMDSTQLVQDRDKWGDLANRVTNLTVL